MEAMCLEAPESMMKEEELEDPTTKPWNLSFLSELEPPSFFLAPFGGWDGVLLKQLDYNVNIFLHESTL